MPRATYAISYTLRFKDAGVRRAYYDHFWQTPWRLFAVAACLGVNACYYAISAGLAQLPAGSSDWLRLGIGGRDGAFAAAIFAWSVGIAAYFLCLAYREVRLATLDPGRRRAGLLNPSGMGIGQQNLLLAFLFVPVMLIRITAEIWLPDDVLALSHDELHQWEAYEAEAFLSTMTLGYAPICALLGVPAVVAMPQALLAALLPVVGVWFDSRVQSGDFSYSEIAGLSSLRVFLGTVTFCITYANALLPLQIWKTSKVERELSRQRDLVMGTIAHDIGTPLQALLLAVDSLKLNANGPLAVEAHEAIDISLHTIGQLRKTILNYVALTEQGTAISPAMLVPVDVAGVVQRSILPLLTQLVKGRGDASVVAKCEVSAPASAGLGGSDADAVADADVLQVIADPDWLIDMLLNLIGNAAKFTSSGHIAVKCFARPRDAPGLGSRPITRLAGPRAAWEAVFAV